MPKAAKKPLAKEVAQRFLDSEILEVDVWEETHAVVVAREKDSRGRSCLDLRWLELAQRRWLDYGNDGCQPVTAEVGTAARAGNRRNL